jgi:hypothetical protein
MNWKKLQILAVLTIARMVTGNTPTGYRYSEIGIWVFKAQGLEAGDPLQHCVAFQSSDDSPRWEIAC